MNKHEKINQLDSDSNELSCQRLDDLPLDPIEPKSSKFDSKYLVSDLDNVRNVSMTLRHQAILFSV